MFGKIGAGELILILIIALVVVGPSKLPELGKAMGKTLGEFKKFSNDLKDDLSLDDKSNKTEKTEKVENKATTENTEILEKADIEKEI